MKWLVPSFVAMPFLMIWYYAMVPASQKALLTLGIDTINSGTFSTVTRMALIIIMTSATIIGVAYFLAYRNPKDFNLSHAIAVLMLALMATGAGEYSREMLRKPYVIGRWMYSNGVRTPYVNRINAEGYLAHSEWVWNGAGGNGTVSSYSRGEAIFRGGMRIVPHAEWVSPLAELLQGRDLSNIRNFIVMLHENKADSPYRKFMPPMTGYAAGRG